MNTSRIAALSRMRDLGPAEAESVRAISDAMFSVLADSNFRLLDTPLLESADLFIRKSGGEVSGSLYAFSDPGGMTVSLRPEFTPSVIRWFIENAPAETLPRRYQYSGPVFRYAGANAGRFRQFQQVGAELIGVSGAEGDAEILKTAVRCLQAAASPGFTLRIGNIGMARDLVNSQGLSEQSQMFIVSNLARIGSDDADLDALTESAAAAGLVVDDADYAPVSESADVAPQLEIVRRSMAGSTGRRSPERIMARLARRMKQASPRSDFRAAIENVARLVSLKGESSRVLSDAEAILSGSAASLSAVRSLKTTLEELESVGVGEDSIRLDLSFVRGLTYYTGMVFEFLGGPDGGYPIGGGGRYNDLVKAFGGPDVPACGFALYVDEVSQVLERRGKVSA